MDQPLYDGTTPLFGAVAASKGRAKAYCNQGFERGHGAASGAVRILLAAGARANHAAQHGDTPVRRRGWAAAHASCGVALRLPAERAARGSHTLTVRTRPSLLHRFSTPPGAGGPSSSTSSCRRAPA